MPRAKASSDVYHEPTVIASKTPRPASILERMASAVNYVWNYCNEVSQQALVRDNRWLSHFDLKTLCVGTSKELGISSETINEICHEYATRRSQSKKRRLKWRSYKRSLGWIPIRMRFLKISSDSIHYQKRRFRFWATRPIEGTPKTGSFTQDARGHWYLNIHCEIENIWYSERKRRNRDRSGS